MMIFLMIDLNASYWENRYKLGQTGWDLGSVSTPLKNYIDQLKNKEISILIPGAGKGYEVEYLFNSGFTSVTVLDFAQQPLDDFKDRVPKFPEEYLIKDNFFKHTKSYDLIFEQTFFCALPIERREDYAKKMKELLNPQGKLVGVLFDFPKTLSGPPFGGSLKEYQSIFKSHFKIKTLERCYNSIKPRQGKELFFIFES